MSHSSYIEELRQWANSFAGFFPPDPETQTQLHWYTPLFGPACSAESIPAEAHGAMMQAAIDAAAHVRQAQPGELSDATVTALIRANDVRWTQVCIFYCLDAYATFHDRQAGDYRWVPLGEDRKISRERGLVLPNGFTEFGHEIIDTSDPDMPAQRDELWTIEAPYD